MPIRVAIIEDHASTREGVIMHLRRAKHLVFTAAYASAEEALIHLPSHMPDVVLVDINLPVKSGIECVRALKADYPKLQILMLTVFDDSDKIFAALRAGANGYLLKRALSDELITAIEEVHRGGSPMSMKIARKVVSHFHESIKPARDLEKLTKREYEILELLAKGLAYKQIADRLNLSPNTVHTHLAAIYKKLHINSCTEAVSKFMSRESPLER